MSQLSQSLRSVNRLALVLPLMLCLGCQTTSKLPGLAKVTPDRNEVPQSVVALWSNSVAPDDAGEQERGLGGRLYFYDEDHQPVAVEGKLVVYAYDDSNSQTINRVPDRKYVFDAEMLADRFSETDLGPSYSVWLPWDGSGDAHRTELSVIPVLTTAKGKVIIGEHARHVLPGPERLASKTEPESDYFSTIRRTSHTDNTTQPGSEVAAIDPLGTTSIRLPDAVQQRLARSRKLPGNRLDRRRELSRRTTLLRGESRQIGVEPTSTTQDEETGSVEQPRQPATRRGNRSGGFQDSRPSVMNAPGDNNTVECVRAFTPQPGGMAKPGLSRQRPR